MPITLLQLRGSRTAGLRYTHCIKTVQNRGVSPHPISYPRVRLIAHLVPVYAALTHTSELSLLENSMSCAETDVSTLIFAEYLQHVLSNNPDVTGWLFSRN
jgi:hypothetical protein